MPKNNKQSKTIETVLILVAFAAVAIFFMTVKNTATAPASIPVAITQPKITDTKGLDDAKDQLNSQNLNQIDSGLDQINTQSQGF